MKVVKYIVLIADNFGRYIASIGLLGMAFSTLYEVFARYFFNSPTKWSVEFGTYFLVLMVFLGAGYTLSHDGHINIDIVIRHLPRGIQFWLNRISVVVCIIFGTLILLETWELMWFSFITKRLSPTPMRIPLFLVQMGLPIGAFLFIISSIGKLFQKSE